VVLHPGAPQRHSQIYLSLFVQARGVLRKELTAHLRTRRTTRRVKTASTAGQSRGQIRDAVSIRDRPAQASDRAVPGHWEGDLIAGSHNSWIATLVERRSRYLMLVRVPGKDTTSVVSALTHHVKTLPTGLMNSLTWDRGTELATHHHFTMSTDVAVYFADPHSPWQRGSNENTVSVVAAREGRSGRLVPAARGDSREHWTSTRCALRWTRPSSCRHQPGPLVLA